MRTQSVPPRLMLYSEAADTGGVTGVVEPLVKGLAGAYDITLVVRSLPPLLQWAASLSAHGITIEPLALENRHDVAGWLEARRLARLHHLLRRTDLLHVHQHTPFSCFPVLFLARQAKVRSVMSTEHYLSQMRFLRRRPLPFPLATVRDTRLGMQMLLKRRTLRILDRIVLVSGANRDLLVSLFPLESAGKTEVIPNGVDLRRFAVGAQSGLPALQTLTGAARPQVVLVVAGLNNQKGHRFLLQAIPAVAAHCPGVSFVLVGDGHLRGDLERMAAALGIAQHVVFAGRRDDVPRLLAASALVVLPSLFEGMPLSVLEAMAAGKAVVATSVDGTAEVVEDGSTGLLVPPGDPAALSRAIVELLTDDERRERFGLRAREHAAQYDQLAMAARYSALYDAMLAMKR